ncbi:MAG: hypothetical protein AVDCRST_MAG89-2409 [uncultured Gemmatimonadetes bacterium]|uniref:Uncharacterized protein n=1 Tax=uncultured Gemmatimonadota bacterium TaxID=203437 RepID=A0A6J4LL39_9BACT|nr:MAG: hypothetical protein AVDCRST_MAG89-2409 [uncultured Gemmatimonadota bacterium]
MISLPAPAPVASRRVLMKRAIALFAVLFSAPAFLACGKDPVQ